MSGTNLSDFKVIITRFETGNQGTFGRLTYNDFSCFTGELPKRDNKPNISCIPKGTYKCTWTKSPRMKKWTYELSGVNGRSSIRIHSANYMGDDSLGFHKQVNGCIALGEKVGVMEGQKALLLSTSAIRQFNDLMEQKDFILEIN